MFIKVVCSLLASLLVCEASKVLEVSDKFLAVRKEGMWLMKFYAPWCGHCKKLEPVWKHVAQSLGDTGVRVARVDCTRFTKVATEFNIRGYPTILFLKGDDTYIYEGDRTREDLVAFSRRLMGPPVQALRTEADLAEAKRNALFFVFSGPLEHPLYEEFLTNARHFHSDEHMYSAAPGLIKTGADSKEAAVFVYKDNQYHKFRQDEFPVERQEREVTEEGEEASPTPATTVVNTPLHSWVVRERFPMFTKVTRGKFGKIMATHKYVVIAVLEENKLEQLTPEMEQFREMVKGVVAGNQEKYLQHFQFGWTGSPDLANSVAMETLSVPSLLVINSTTHHHHLPEDSAEYLTPEAIEIFLDSVLAGEAPRYGGNSWLVRIYRSFYEAKTSLFDMWRGNPVLTAVLIGLPLGFLSLIFYSICCADIMDADEEEEELEDYHEKAE